MTGARERARKLYLEVVSVQGDIMDEAWGSAVDEVAYRHSMNPDDLQDILTGELGRMYGGGES